MTSSIRKTVAIIQARTGSSRLPGKVLLKLGDRTVLEHVIARVQLADEIDTIVIATTDRSQDDHLATLAEACGVACFRGSESDVLARYYFAARESQADIIVRITSDCPLYDPRVGNAVVRYFKDHAYDIVCNCGALEPAGRSYPRGLDTEVFSFVALEDAFHHAVESYQREHVTPYIYQSTTNTTCNYRQDNDYSYLRWTLDTPEDLAFIETVYARFYRGTHDFFLEDIVSWLHANPQVVKLNAGVIQKNYHAVKSSA